MSISRTRDEGGYTLIEFAVSLLVLGIFLSFATPFMFGQLRAAKRTEDRLDLQQSARGTLRTLVRDLRQAETLYQIENPSGKTTMSFWVDFNGNGTVETSNERITYYVKQGTNTLYRGPKWNEGQPIAENVQALTFTMFGSNLAFDTDGDGTVTETELNPGETPGAIVWDPSDLANVTRIRVTLSVATGGTTQTYSGDAWLRNRVVG